MVFCFHQIGEMPHPVFDSQVAAMVCGFGDVGDDLLDCPRGGQRQLRVDARQISSRFVPQRTDRPGRDSSWLPAQSAEA